MIRILPASANETWYFPSMKQNIAAVTLLVPDYNKAIAYYVGKLGFMLAEDTALSPTKRWVVVTPPGNGETASSSPKLIRRINRRPSATRRAAASSSS